MTCTCCETGRCCKGSVCTATSQSECVHRFGTFTTGGDCTQYACTAAPPYDRPCTLSDACACSAVGKVLRAPETTCNCTTLTAAGVPHGGCQAYYCNACVSGSCALTCISPRQCCAGTCCAESQSCNVSSGNCVNKCGSGTTYCNTTASGGAYAYACCSSGTKCCGASGCLPNTATTTFNVNVATNGWQDTGVDVSGSVTITATGTATWAGGRSDATPNGVPSGECFNYISCSVDGSLCHMRLMGRVDAGALFSVGTSYTGTPGTGRLFLRTNDVCTSDNAGSFTATITAPSDPCPGFTPAAFGEPIVYASGAEPPRPSPGPGAELKFLLGLAGIVSSPTCSCNARAAQMDAWGEWESLKRLPEICGWLKEEAEKREMWFFRPAGYALISAAVLLSALKRPFRGNS